LYLWASGPSTDIFISNFVATAAAFHQSIQVLEDIGRSRASRSPTDIFVSDLWQLHPRASSEEGAASARAEKRVTARIENFMVEVRFEDGSSDFVLTLRPLWRDFGEELRLEWAE
jgi:hypothetical protein